MVVGGVGLSSDYQVVVSYNQVTYRVGALIHLSCGAGYKLSSPSNITCQESGNWDFQGTITCNPGNNTLQFLFY